VSGVSLGCRGVTRSFDNGLVPVLRGIDLDVAAGERVAVVGRTGCGKSTLLLILALLDRPDGGELTIDGDPWRRIGSPERWRAARVGIVFQLHHLLLHLTAAENLALPLVAFDRHERRRRVDAMLERLGLRDRARTPAMRLSGGERQLVAIGRALVTSPRLLLADEPTGSVDSQTSELVVDLLTEEAASRGATLLMVTHDLTLAHRLDRVVTMIDGRVDEGARCSS
jgi:ABC-type lipoprotein export system ATPase subunit